MNNKSQEIIIRDWIIEDIPTYKKWNTGHHLWMDFNGPYYDNLTKVELENSIKKIKCNIEKDTFPNPRNELVIAYKETNKMIGMVSSYWQSKETNWLSIGVVIYDKNNWSKGIGKESLLLWCKYLFDARPEICRLDMRTWSGNHGLMKLAEKVGFKLEAVFRKARIVKGEYYDSIGYGLLREEFIVF